MFIENYRLETMIGGQAQSMIPYPKISDEDWLKLEGVSSGEGRSNLQDRVVGQAKGPSSPRLWYSDRCLPRNDAGS